MQSSSYCEVFKALLSETADNASSRPNTPRENESSMSNSKGEDEKTILENNPVSHGVQDKEEKVEKGNGHLLDPDCAQFFFDDKLSGKQTFFIMPASCSASLNLQSVQSDSTSINSVEIRRMLNEESTGRQTFYIPGDERKKFGV